MKLAENLRAELPVKKVDSETPQNVMLACSEYNFIAADNLRSALADLTAAHELLLELLLLARDQTATMTKES